MKAVQDWRPRDAWLFAGLSLLCTILITTFVIIFAIAFPSSERFLRGANVRSILLVISTCVFCGISIVQAKIRSLSELKLAFDLFKPRETDVLGSLAIGAALQFAGIILFSRDFSLSNIHIAHSLAIKKIPALFSPFLEELPMRGFVYKAFRNSYSVTASVFFTVVISLIFHTQIWGSLYQFLGIATGNIMLCLIKERKLSLWNCIACHFAFNAIFVGLAP